jgi:hypothetical protein
MADFNSSLPIRTEQPGDVQMKLVSGDNTARALKIEADGSINANVSVSNLDVRDLVFATDKVDVSGSSVSVSNFPSSFEVSNFPSLADLDIRNLSELQDSVTAHLAAGSSLEVSNFPASFEVSNFPASFEISNTVTMQATDLDIRDLSYLQDSVTAHLASGSQIEITNASLTVEATDLDIRPLSSATDSITVSATAFDIRALSAATDSMTVQATDLDIRNLSHSQDSLKIGDGTDFMAINGDGSLNVKLIEKTQAYSYQNDSAIAASASATHEFTSSADSMVASAVRASASGKMKIEVKLETGAGSGVFNTVAVAYNSAANPNIDLSLEEVVPVLNGRKIQIVKYNRDSSAMDMHSTLLYKY